MPQQTNQRSNQEAGAKRPQPRQDFARRPGKERARDEHTDAQDAARTHREPFGTAAQVNNLMREIGSKHGYNPVPPAQTKWIMGILEDPRVAHPLSLIRMWALIVDNTLDWGSSRYTADFGQRTPYATLNRKGRALTLEHIAAELEMHIANARKVFQEGIDVGLWRRGSEDEGEERVYICGETKPQIRPESPDKKYVHTFSEQPPSYVIKHLETLTKEKRTEFMTRWEQTARLEKAALAGIVAQTREIINQVQDTLIEEIGATPRRCKHPKPAAQETEEARQEREAAERRRSLAAALRAPIEKYVHTLQTDVQTSNPTVYEVETEPCTDPATLLPQSTQSEQSARASDDSAEGPPRTGRGTPSHQGERVGYLPAAEEAITAWSKTPSAKLELPAAEAAVEACLRYPDVAQTMFFELGRIKEIAPYPPFSEFSEDRKTDQILVGRLILITGAGGAPQVAVQFLLSVLAKIKGLRGGLAKLPPRAPGDPSGPRVMGLMLEWAKDFRRGQ
jgi:hypothetical protein